MAPSSFGPFDDVPGEQPPRRNIFLNNSSATSTTNPFGATSNSSKNSSSSFAGETPFRPNGGGSVFSPNPTFGGTKPVGGLFGTGGGFQKHKMDVDQEPVVDVTDEDDEDGEYEVDESPAAVRKLPAGGFNLLSQGIPKLAPGRAQEVDYSSPTDGDDEGSPKEYYEEEYEEGEGEEEEEEYDEDEEQEEDEAEEEEEEEDEDGEYDEEEDHGEQGEVDEGNNENMDIDDGFHPSAHKKSPTKRKSKAPISARIFLANNPPSLIAQSNDILNSLTGLLSPPSFDEEEALPGASPHYNRDDLKPAKKAAYLVDHVQLFLAHLQHVAHTTPHSSLPNAHYLAHIVLQLHHPQALANGGRGNSPIEVYRQFIDTHHPNPSRDELQDLHAYHPSASASPSYWDILAHLTLRGELSEVEALLQRGGWDNIEVEKDGVVSYKYADDELAVIERVTGGACRLLAAAPALFSKGRTEDEKYGEWRIYRGRVAAAMEELRSLSSSAPQREEAVPEEDEEPEYRLEKVTTMRNGFTTKMIQKVPVIKPSRKHPVRGDEKPITRVARDVEIGLMNIYNILSGKIDAIIAVCERWEEAVLGVVIWRRYLDDAELEDDAAEAADGMDGSAPGTRTFLNRSIRATSALRTANLRKPLQDKRQSRRTISDLECLKAAFKRVTSRDLPIDTTSQRELGLSHALQGDWKAVIDVLTDTRQSHGMTAHSTAAFILQVARLAEWSVKDCEDLAGQGNLDVPLGSFFDARDASSFSKGIDVEKERAKRARKREEKVIEGYARCLVEAGHINANDRSSADEAELGMDVDGRAHHEDSDSETGKTFEGWEIAMQLLDRWSRITLGEAGPWSRKLASEILASLPLTDPAQVEKLLHHCKSYSLDDTYTRIAASYADHLYGNSQLGSSLLYFSRAANRVKIHSILTRLLAQSLLLSTAYPPRERLDETLTQMLERPSGEEDEMLRYELSGYAAVRVFYDARDEGRMEDATRALVALIRSAGEMVDGGRGVDDEWESAVEWWTAGSLIGEALAFLNQSKRHFTIREIFDILKVLQDLSSAIESTTPPSSSPSAASTNKADTFLRNSLLAYTVPTSIPRLLKKPVSRLTSTSTSSISTSRRMGSSTMASSWQEVGGGAGSSEEGSEADEDEDRDEEGFAFVDGTGKDQDGGQFNVPRGWDWRAGMIKLLEMEELEARRRATASSSNTTTTTTSTTTQPQQTGYSSSNGNGNGLKRSIGKVLEMVVRVARIGFAKELARAWLDGDGDGEDAVEGGLPLPKTAAAAALGLGLGKAPGMQVPYITISDTPGVEQPRGRSEYMDLGL